MLPCLSKCPGFWLNVGKKENVTVLFHFHYQSIQTLNLQCTYHHRWEDTHPHYTSDVSTNRAASFNVSIPESQRVTIIS